MQIISEEEYLQMLGFGALSGYTLDKCKIPHGETERQERRRLEQTEAAISAFYEAKQAARREYRERVKRGELRPPTTIEAAIKAANGDENTEQTQAARRFLTKRGIDWKNNK